MRSRQDSIELFCHWAVKKVGTVHVLVNNAGISTGDKAPLDQTLQEASDNFENVMGTNVKGCWFMARAVGQLMRDHRHGGSIINVASYWE
jgi:NAD(P)-dependent dehydrogenase (short-subunit alcohol dehydrogenase family)